MEAHFTPDQQIRLLRMTVAQGRAAEAFVQEAIKRQVGYEECFSAKSIHAGLLPISANSLSTTPFATGSKPDIRHRK